MARGPDSQTLLTRALVAGAAGAGVTIAVRTADSCGWHSATFAGQRHIITVEAKDTPGLADWLGMLSDAELTVRGHLVADIAVSTLIRSDGIATATLEALTLEQV